MESAIDKHLQCPRALSRRVADDYEPPFPMWVARAKEDLCQVVMGYFGVQYLGAEKEEMAMAALRRIVSDFALPDGPGHYDLTCHQDAHGYENLMAVGYWRDPNAYKRWLSSPVVSGRWESEDRLQEEVGYFREIVAPRAEQFETLYAFREQLPGVGAIMDGISDEVQEHGYWGSMRDRFPISQTDRMQPSGKLEIVEGNPQSQGRVIIRGHDNIALIRSGQDWAETEGDERDLYLRKIEPTLRAGMDFLRDNGKEVGCYSNRYVQYIDLDGSRLEKSYNIGHWRSLDLLERWAEAHPTHLRIFTTFFRVAADLSKLRLYHEVSVFNASDQFYEYINCHPQTGMMRDAMVSDG
ncbi:phenylacetaldoxime dehydratase family protein [Nitratireductor sp. GCM10026969]|uniref:aliphatic aldoxime dehydratase n=1 Tax=Nitratireductor sp. GCM10026969 TaxID=3252645 RepID=UPI00361CBE5D